MDSEAELSEHKQDQDAAVVRLSDARGVKLRDAGVAAAGRFSPIS